MAFTPLAFTGISQYSEDLNTVLKRAVSIASLPLTRLQNDTADILSRKSALGSLTAPVASLATAIAALGTIGATRAMLASSSDTTKVAVTYSGATAPATYSISEITSVARAASAIIADWFGGTTRSSSPCNRTIGHTSRSTK